ncbi:MAG: MarR family transcriptional regulator [Xanthomonadaceae bacterium]|nr:MarR family transcriptional regulator [Xanthomonadaceae bacterium]
MLFQECICFSLGKVSRQMARAYRETLTRYGISQPQFFLLIALYEEDDILISRLAEKVALDKSTLTGILDRLERDGLVNRVSRPEDRRSLYVCLTAKAHSLEQDLTRIYNDTNHHYLANITDQERMIFDEVLKKLEMIDSS